MRRDLGYTEGALEDYQKAISLGPDRARRIAGEASSICATANTLRRLPISTTRCSFLPTMRRICSEPMRVRIPATTTARWPTTAMSFSTTARNAAALTGTRAIWRKRGDLDKALALYDRAIAADHNRAEIYKLRAEIYAAKGERKQAVADLSQALKSSHHPIFCNDAAELRLDEGDVSGALQDANAALKLEPKNAAGLTLRDAALARKKEETQAAEARKAAEEKAREAREKERAAEQQAREKQRVAEREAREKQRIAEREAREKQRAAEREAQLAAEKARKEAAQQKPPENRKPKHLRLRSRSGKEKPRCRHRPCRRRRKLRRKRRVASPAPAVAPPRTKPVETEHPQQLLPRSLPRARRARETRDARGAGAAGAKSCGA